MGLAQPKDADFGKQPPRKFPLSLLNLVVQAAVADLANLAAPTKEDVGTTPSEFDALFAENKGKKTEPKISPEVFERMSAEIATIAAIIEKARCAQQKAVILQDLDQAKLRGIALQLHGARKVSLASQLDAALQGSAVE